MDDGDATKTLAFELSAHAAGADAVIIGDIPADRSFSLPKYTGRLGIVGDGSSAAGVLGKIDFNGQTGDLGATTLLTSDSNAVGLFRCVFYLKTTTAGSGPAAVKVTVSYNDGSAQSADVILVPEIATPGGGAVNHDLTVANQASYGSILVYAAASTAITFITTGDYTGSPAYTIRARIEALG